MYGVGVTGDQSTPQTAGRPQAQAGWPGAGRASLLTLRFLTELALLAVLAAAGAQASTGLGWRVLLAILAPVAAMIVWGLAIGPRAPRRLGDPLRFGVEVVLFGVAAASLALTGPVLVAVVFAVVAVAVAIMVRLIAAGS
jgi:Protein of unknown function (DUF2568)